MLPCGSQATLLSRLGGQAYYDTVLGITWLTNTNLAWTNSFGINGIAADGGMSWDLALDWIDALNADGGKGHLGFNDWRLPALRPVNGSSFTTGGSNNGTKDLGYGASGIGWQSPSGEFVSEMGYMYYVNLGNLGLCTPNDANPGLCNAQPGFGLANAGPFLNLPLSGGTTAYWAGLEYNAISSWMFDFSVGRQDENGKGFGNFAWAVRSGDVAALVPEPATIGLIGIGLIGLTRVEQRKRG